MGYYFSNFHFHWESLQQINEVKIITIITKLPGSQHKINDPFQYYLSELLCNFKTFYDCLKSPLTHSLSCNLFLFYLT